jgi:hypothetical protein
MVAMVILLRLGKAWSNILAALCMYGLCYSVIWVDRYRVAAAGDHVVPMLSLALAALVGICALGKWKVRLVHGLVGAFLLVCGGVTLTACQVEQFQYDLYNVHRNPAIMLPVVVAMMVAGCLMIFTKDRI